MKIQYIAPIGELSGYGEFSRNVISGLTKIGADVKVQPLIFDKRQISIKHGCVLGRHTNPDVCIINIVPSLFEANKSKGAINVGYTMWEASRLPAMWVEACNKMDAILVPSLSNVQVFEDSGVKVPVLYAPPGVDFSAYDVKRKPREGPFVFYSILQWGERKNPLGLIRAYWAAFASTDSDVVLRLKLYLKDQDQAEFARINTELANLRRAVRLRRYPKVEFVIDHMTQAQMIDFHLAGDCFVSATRGEGLGLGLLEALALETPAIATATGGHASVASFGSYFEIGCGHVPAMNSGPYSLYEGDMYWAEPDLFEMANAMMEVYSNHGPESTAAKYAAAGAREVRKKFDLSARSEEILKILQGLKKGQGER